MVDENSVFCPYCGVRMDGKVCCYACGSAVDKDAAFCPSCGAGLNKNNLAAATSARIEGQGVLGGQYYGKVERKVRSGESLYCRVERYITPSVLLLGILISFILSFFVGITAEISTINGSITETENFIYFLKDNFNQISQLLSSPETAELRAKTPIAFSMYFPAIIAAIGIGGNILASFICLLIGSIKLGLGFKSGKKVNLFPLAGICMGTLVLAAGFAGEYLIDVSTLGNINNSISSGEILYTYSSGTVVAFVIFGLLIIGAIVLNAISEGKDAVSMKNLSKIICGSLSVILCIVIFAVANVNYIKITFEEGKFYGTSNIFMLVTCGLILEMPAGTDLTGIAVGSIMSNIAVIALLASVAVFIMFLIYKSGAKTDGKLSWLISGICILIFAVIYLVGAIMVKNNYFTLSQSGGVIGVGAPGPIVSLVMSVIILVAVVTNMIISVIADRKRAPAYDSGSDETPRINKFSNPIFF